MDWKPEVDLHCHILPDWDDGPNTLDDALAMCERALEAGMTTVVATPHVGRRFAFRETVRPSATIGDGVQKLQSELDARGLKLQIVPGAEILMGAVDLQERLPGDLALTYGHAGKFALVESPHATWPHFGRGVVGAMERAGVRAVLAHPERYLDVQKDLKIIEPVVFSGALVQLTAGAITGQMGKANRATSYEMLRRGWVSFVSSDAHNLTHVLPRDAVEEVVKIVGEDAARTIFVENPRRLLNGERITPPTPQITPKKSGLFGFLKRN